MPDRPKGRAVPPAEQRVEVTSGYGANTRSPFVALTVNDAMTQMTPAKAREIALMLMASADAAESDGFIVEWIGEAVGLDQRQRASLLMEFRAYRDRERERQARHDYPPSESV